jgi:hypothetical protein
MGIAYAFIVFTIIFSHTKKTFTLQSLININKSPQICGQWIIDTIGAL